MKIKTQLALALLALCSLLASTASAAPRSRLPVQPLPPAGCTTTTVKAQIFDPQGFWYSFATIRIQLTATASQPLCDGQPFGAGPFAVNTDETGNFTLNLPSNDHISPGGTQWTFFVNGQANIGNPQVGGGKPVGQGDQTFSIAAQTINAGATVDLSSTFNAAAVSLTNICESLWAATHPGSFPSATCGGGGGGCTLPGINTAVLSEHPVGSCYGSLHFTWDDGTNKQNLQAGLGNTIAGQGLMIFGNSNTANSPIYFGAILGRGNTLATNGDTLGATTDLYAVGIGNTLNGEKGEGELGAFGDGNTIDGLATAGSGNAWAFGNGNVLYNVADSVVHGISNTIGVKTATGFSHRGSIVGYLNGVNTFNGNGQETYWGAFGDNNAIDRADTSVNGSCGQCYDFGSANVAQSVPQGSWLFGFDNNSNNGGTQDATVFGASNTIENLANCVASGCPGAQDSSIFGTQNTMNGAGSGVIAGTDNNLTSCSACMIVGYHIDFSTNFALGLGMGPNGTTHSAPQLVFTNDGNMKRTPVTFATLPACAAGTEGGIAAITDSTTNTWGATITGSGTNHVLGYCDGTNWTVAAK